MTGVQTCALPIYVLGNAIAVSRLHIDAAHRAPRLQDPGFRGHDLAQALNLGAINGATGQQSKNETQLVAIIAYNAHGAGNGLVVHKDSPFYALEDGVSDYVQSHLTNADPYR